MNPPPSEETSDTRVTQAALRISATPGPVDPELVSAACLPQNTTLAPVLLTAAANSACT